MLQLYYELCIVKPLDEASFTFGEISADFGIVFINVID